MSDTKTKTVKGIEYRKPSYMEFWYTNLDGVIEHAKLLGFTKIRLYNDPPQPIDEYRIISKRSRPHEQGPHYFKYRLKLPRRGKWTIYLQASIRTDYDDIHGMSGAIELVKEKS